MLFTDAHGRYFRVRTRTLAKLPENADARTTLLPYVLPQLPRLPTTAMLGAGVEAAWRLSELRIPGWARKLAFALPPSQLRRALYYIARTGDPDEEGDALIMLFETWRASGSAGFAYIELEKHLNALRVPHTEALTDERDGWLEWLDPLEEA